LSPRFTKPVQPGFYSPSIIEDEVWVGANAIILGGVTIGIGAVIGAGSVVVRNIPPFTVGVGNPCRPIRKIFSDEVLESHMQGIGYTDTLIQLTIQRRRNELAGMNLATVDKSQQFTGKIHEVRPG
jgi:tetrahydrodipicolinate N-succinyltransferase